MKKSSSKQTKRQGSDKHAKQSHIRTNGLKPHTPKERVIPVEVRDFVKAFNRRTCGVVPHGTLAS